VGKWGVNGKPDSTVVGPAFRNFHCLGVYCKLKYTVIARGEDKQSKVTHVNLTPEEHKELIREDLPRGPQRTWSKCWAAEASLFLQIDADAFFLSDHFHIARHEKHRTHLNWNCQECRRRRSQIWFKRHFAVFEPGRIKNQTMRCVP
jgi:hypothetical protein